jgi:hypothetical protein
MNIGVYGNGLDSLIACYELLDKGHDVEHFSGGARIAGHFAGSSDGHGIFDLGMVLLEKDVRDTPQRPLSEFSNEFGVNVREYFSESYDFVEKAFGALRPRKVRSRLENSDEIGDYFIADNLEVFKTLSVEERSSLQARLTEILNNQESDFIHPRMKNQKTSSVNDELLMQLEIQYGPELAGRLFGSFINSLVGSKETKIPVRFHRKLWTPLYFPETIEATIRSNNSPLPELSFLEFTDGSVASKIQKLIESISNNCRYSLNLVKFEDLYEMNSQLDYQIFITPVAEMTKLLKSQKVEESSNRIASSIIRGPQTKINILHLCVKKMENKTVMLQSPIENLFRYSITNGMACDQSCISLEFGEIGKSTRDELLPIVEIVEPEIELVCRGVLQVVPFSPRYLNMSLHEWNLLCAAVIGEFPKENCRVLPIHPDGASFNDNLVRGLAASRGIGF